MVERVFLRETRPAEIRHPCRNVVCVWVVSVDLSLLNTRAWLRWPHASLGIRRCSVSSNGEPDGDVLFVFYSSLLADISENCSRICSRSHKCFVVFCGLNREVPPVQPEPSAWKVWCKSEMLLGLSPMSFDMKLKPLLKDFAEVFSTSCCGDLRSEQWMCYWAKAPVIIASSSSVSEATTLMIWLSSVN